MKMSVVYSIGTNTERITEVIEVRDWGKDGAMAILRERYPNKQITIHSYSEIH